MKHLVAGLVLLLFAGCAVLPNTLRAEWAHVSHPMAGWPFEPQSGSEDELNTVGVVGRWQFGHAYIDAGLAQKLQGRNANGFIGPALTGTVRAGVEIRLR
ncbi:MAG: hypothetical protein ABI859_16860 [Pseudomonadota bacterium]